MAVLTRHENLGIQLVCFTISNAQTFLQGLLRTESAYSAGTSHRSALSILPSRMPIWLAAM
jgi:hypothetical protein